MFEEYNSPDKQGFLSRFQRARDKQIELTQLNIASFGTFVPRPVEPLPEPPPEPASTPVWVEPPSKPITTDLGSAVEDPYLDSLRQRSLSSDVGERAEFYDQIDLLYLNDPILYKSREDALEGAFGLDATQKVEPGKKFEKDTQAREMADNCDRLWQALAEMLTPDIRIKRMREYLTYGNLFPQIQFNNYGVITKTRALPVKTMKINSNQQLEFTKDQPDAFVQYVRDNYTHPHRNFKEIEIYPILNTQFESDRYGMPFVLPGLSYSRGFIRGSNTLPQAREGGMPFVHKNQRDALGNPVGPETKREMDWNLRQNRIARGEKITGYDQESTNGNVTMEMVASDSNYWGEITDLRFFAAIISKTFNRNLAKLIGADLINRATLDRITENEYESDYILALLFFYLHDRVLMQRMIEIANFYVALMDRSYGLEPGKLFIDPKKVQLNTQVKGRRLPERLKADTDTAIALYDKGLLDQESAVEVSCRQLDLEPSKVISRLKAEGRWKQDQNRDQNNLPPQINSVTQQQLKPIPEQKQLPAKSEQDDQED